MYLKTTISVIGGDKRIEYLVQMLKQEKCNIKTFGMENSEMICKEDKGSSRKECIENSKMNSDNQFEYLEKIIKKP